MLDIAVEVQVKNFRVINPSIGIEAYSLAAVALHHLHLCSLDPINDFVAASFKSRASIFIKDIVP